MSKVLVIVEAAGGQVRSSSLPGITCGQQIARAAGGELHLLVLGQGAADAASAAASAGYGATVVHSAADSSGLDPFTAEAWTDAVLATVESIGATAFGGTATSTLREVVPRTAALLDAPMAVEVVAVKGADTFTRPVSAGRALLDVRMKSTPFGFTARGSEFEPAQATTTPATTADVAVTTDSRGATVDGIEKTESSRPALSEADVVVSGGRGMREGANFEILERLTDLLGGALGASRAATDAGMVPADLQVGQTGKVVAPNLYIAVAISGAIQHLAGMKGSKTIVAINKDPEAPIFGVSDYGLVAKWEDALPALIEAVQQRKTGG